MKAKALAIQHKKVWKRICMKYILLWLDESSLPLSLLTTKNWSPNTSPRPEQ